MKTALQIQQEIDQKNSQVEAILACCKDENREPSEDEQSAIDAFYGSDGESGELAQLEAQLKNKNAIENRQKQIAATKLGSAIRRQETALAKTDLVPASCKRHGVLQAFSNDAQGQKDAYISGRYMLAKIFNHEPSKQFLKDHGIMAQQSGGTAGRGLELVPEPLEAAILKRLQMLSPIRQKARMTTMTSQTHRIPDRLSGLTVYYPDELQAITESHMTFGQIVLTARKMATLTQVSSELTEDAIISIMDELAMDIAYQFSQKENDDAFNGDGTATYGSVTGLANAVGANSQVVAGSTDPAAFTLAEYEAVIAKNPFFQGAMPEWYCSSAVWAGSMEPLAHAQGGSTATELVDGVRRSFKGYPVNIVQVMASTPAASTPFVYFGTLSQSVFFGQRRGVTIATSEHYGFNTDSIYIRGTQRNAITVDNHDTTSAGPVTAIFSAAS